MSMFLKNYSLMELIYLLIKFNKSKFFPWNTNSTNGNSVNKQNTTCTPNTQKNNTGMG